VQGRLPDDLCFSYLLLVSVNCDGLLLNAGPFFVKKTQLLKSRC